MLKFGIFLLCAELTYHWMKWKSHDRRRCQVRACSATVAVVLELAVMLARHSRNLVLTLSSTSKWILTAANVFCIRKSQNLMQKIQQNGEISAIVCLCDVLKSEWHIGSWLITKIQYIASTVIAVNKWLIYLIFLLPVHFDCPLIMAMKQVCCIIYNNWILTRTISFKSVSRKQMTT